MKSMLECWWKFGIFQYNFLTNQYLFSNLFFFISKKSNINTKTKLLRQCTKTETKTKFSPLLPWSSAKSELTMTFKYNRGEYDFDLGLDLDLDLNKCMFTKTKANNWQTFDKRGGIPKKGWNPQQGVVQLYYWQTKLDLTFIFQCD